MKLLRQFVLRPLYRHGSALRARLCPFREQSGSALVELALTLSIVGVPLLLGTSHFAVLEFNSIIIANAAHAGAQYGMHNNTFAGATATIISAAQDDSGLGTKLTVVPTVFFACSSAVGGTRYANITDANNVCTGSSHSLEFIQVVASADVTPTAKLPGFPNTVTLTSTSVMVVQE